MQAIFQRYNLSGEPVWLCGQGFVEVIQARHAHQVMPALEAVQRAVDGGLFAAGFIAYEAAGGIDPHLAVGAPSAGPLVWFALFRQMAELTTPPMPPQGNCTLGEWQPSVSADQYRSAIARIRDYIAQGDTYQVNYTFRLRATFAGEPWPLFCRLCRSQRAQYGAYIDTGETVICSASPELFFQLDGQKIACQPMKGTAPRGMMQARDLQLRAELEASPKNRAENAMIVDMMRNDLGRIAQPGSVQADPVFQVEKYPTVLQMTSTVQARTDAAFPQIIEALFPCASITGAPKIRTMEIIRELEGEPRGVYTGCIGYLAPGRKARFSVAIRTVAIDRSRGQAEYGVGGGIVWDSLCQDEYEECRTKAAVLTAQWPAFDLLETILYRGAEGYFLLDGHLSRLGESAGYFDFPANLSAIRSSLEELAGHMGDKLYRVRLRVDRQGRHTLEAAPFSPSTGPWTLRPAARAVDSRNVFLYHKTTHRGVYDAARASAGDCDDAILFNERGEVTETSIANIVVELDGQLVTPPIECGLLGGVFRAHLLATGQVRERVVTLADLRKATKVFAVNSVRTWVPATIRFE